MPHFKRSPQKLFCIAATALLLASCNAQIVDSAQPVKAGDKFYSLLKSGDVRASLSHFAPEFKSLVENWPSLLDNMQQKYGPVTSAELQKTNPGAYEHGPCFLLTYSVKRGLLASSESLYLCSKEGKSPWLIHGQQLTRLDTQQTVSAGTLPEAIEIMGVDVP